MIGFVFQLIWLLVSVAMQLAFLLGRVLGHLIAALIRAGRSAGSTRQGRSAEMDRGTDPSPIPASSKPKGIFRVPASGAATFRRRPSFRPSARRGWRR